MSDAERELLLDCYRAALGAVEGRAAVARALRRRPLAPGPVRLIAVGKAAAAMARGAVDVLGDAVAGGVVVTREGYADPELPGLAPLRQLESSHPVPDERSLAAGEALVAELAGAPADARYLCLVSGGASSLVERLPEGVGIEALAALNEALLASGRDIHAMNRIRKAVSRIKGGRLGRLLDGRPARALLISDVHGDDPTVIGSGLFFPDATPSDPGDLPPDLAALCPPAEPAPTPDDPAFAGLEAELVASNRDALDAAAAAAERKGVAVHRHRRFLEGDAVAGGRMIGETLGTGEPGLHLWGGEPTVILPEQPGRGGRMQALALAAATAIDGRDDVWLLAAGTDGADGPGGDAGALVDGGTIARGEAGGYAAEAALAAADAGSFLAASGDLIRTGGTGTNVMDVVIGLRRPPADA